MTARTVDGMRAALAYLAALETGDEEGLDVMDSHTDPGVLARHLAWVANRVMTMAAFPSSAVGVAAFFDAVDLVHPLGSDAS